MNSNTTTVSINNYTGLLEQVSDLLNLTLSEIRNKCADYPYCLIDYFEKDVTEKSIEICFDKEEITLTCLFNTEGKCSSVYLFSDKDETIEELICMLKETYEYNFIKNRWTASGYYISVKETTYLPHNIYAVFYS